jgi:hypothetical protein
LAVAEGPISRDTRSASAVVVLLVVVGYFSYCLHRFTYLPGADAYYYALQTQSLLDSGHLKVPDGGVLCFVIAGVSRLGFSIETSFRLALAAIYAVYNLGLLMIVLRLKQKARALAALLWILASVVIFFHTVEFPQLSLGLAFVPIWFWLLTSAFKGRLIWLAGLLLACAFVHPAVAVAGLLFVITIALGRTVAPERAARPISIGTWVVGAILIAALLVGGAARWPGSAQRLSSIAPGAPTLFGFAMAVGVPYDLKVVVLFFWAILLLLVPTSLRDGSRRWRYLLPATLALPLFPTRDASLFGLGGRLAGIFIFLALPLGIQVLNTMREDSKFFLWANVPGRVSYLAVVLVIAIATVPIRLTGYMGLLAGSDYAEFEKVVSVLGREDIPMLIAHRGLDFFYSYRLRRDAFHFDPEPSWDRAEIWRVAVRVTPEEIAYYSPASCRWGETAKWIADTQYLLVREDCWEQLRARLNPKDNPDLYTEVWEDMENPSQPRPAFLRARHQGIVERAFPAFARAGE